ncbi:MAG: acyltransferase [Acidimicrobiia bacterium]|nr:acyltransferase [Acidimicrobiia bacterium]
MPALDGLRGAAVVAVLFFHGGYLTGGYLGVDLFFVLSGFLITSLLLQEWGSTGSVKLGAFWARRARRLLPALFGMLAGVAVYAWLFADPGELSRIRADGIATVAYVANWHSIFAETSYWELFVAPSPLEHTWSLAIEEQFYLIWPLVVLGLLRWRSGRLRPVFLTALGVAVASAVWMLVLYTPGGDPERVYLGTDTRAMAVLLGAALAVWLRSTGPARTPRARHAVEGVGIVGAAGLVWAWVALDGTSDVLYLGGLFACGVGAVAVIAAGAKPRPGPLGLALSFPPLRWLGLISYGLYLWHWPVFVTMSPARMGFTGWPLFVCRVAVSLAFAVTSYFVLEMPIRRGALSKPTFKVLAPAAAAVAVLALVASTAGARSSPFDPALAIDGDLPPPTAPPGPTTPDPNAPDTTTVLVLGDSVGALLGLGMQDVQDDYSVFTWNKAVPGCVLLSHRPSLCAGEWPDDLAESDPDVAFIFQGAPGLATWEVDGETFTACDTRFTDFYVDAMTTEVRAIQASGVVVALGTSPTAVADGVPADTEERFGCFNDAIRAVADATGATLVDLDGFTCPDGECRLEDDGVVLRPDGIHFEGEGANIAANWVMPQLVDAAP